MKKSKFKNIIQEEFNKIFEEKATQDTTFDRGSFGPTKEEDADIQKLVNLIEAKWSVEIKDIKEIQIETTANGNWLIYYNYKPLGIIPRKYITNDMIETYGIEFVPDEV